MSGKIYFFSDLHLGLPNEQKSRLREKKLVRLLDRLKEDAEAFFFAGDIFDFWWEYKKVVPRGFTRFLGKIAEITDSGIPVHFFSGNHDFYMRNYLPKEIGVEIYHKEQVFILQNKQVFIGHGDGLGPDEKNYNRMKKTFRNPFLQWLYSRLHPNTAVGIAHRWSRSRRKKESYVHFGGTERENQLLFAKEHAQNHKLDYYIFGHRHIPYIIKLQEGGTIANIGEWLHNYTFLELSEGELILKTYKQNKIENYSSDLGKAYRVNLF